MSSLIRVIRTSKYGYLSFARTTSEDLNLQVRLVHRLQPLGSKA